MLSDRLPALERTRSTRRGNKPWALVLALVLTPSGLSGLALAATDAGSSETLTLEKRTQLLTVLHQSQATTLRLMERTPEGLWATRPAADRWSVAEVVEHLVLAEARVLGMVQRLAEAEPDPGWRSFTQPSVAELVRLGSDRSTRFTAPEFIQPTGELSRSKALSELVSGRGKTLHWVLTTEAPLETVTSDAPNGQKLTGTGWLAFLAAHNERHNEQIREVLEELGVEASGSE